MGQFPIYREATKGKTMNDENKKLEFVGVFNGQSVYHDHTACDDGYYYDVVLEDGTIIGEVYDGWLEWVADGWEILNQ